MDNNTFKCDCCLEIFTKGQSEEEAMTESYYYFPENKIEDQALVCDGCFIKIMDFNKHKRDYSKN